MSQKAYRSLVTDVSTDSNILGRSGEERKEPNGKKYLLVKAGEAIASGILCTTSVYDSVSGDMTVVIASGAGLQQAMCANTTGKTLSSGEYFWAQTRGPAELTSGASIIVSRPAYLDSANGKCDDSAVQEKIGVAMEAASGADEATWIFLQM